jgi:hypothetical protein
MRVCDFTVPLEPDETGGYVVTCPALLGVSATATPLPTRWRTLNKHLNFASRIYAGDTNPLTLPARCCSILDFY